MNPEASGGNQTSLVGPRSQRLPPYVVAAAFLLSRLLYNQAGIRFQSETLVTFWQFLSRDLLTTDLWRSLLYLHSQPPLMNLLTAPVLILFPSSYAGAFRIAFTLTGLAAALSMYFLGTAIGLPRWPHAVLTIWFAVSPATVLYENWLFYTYPLAAVLCLGMLGIFHFLRTKNTWMGAGVIALLLILPLTWSLFHLIWLLGMGLVMMLSSVQRRKVLAITMIPMMIVGAWYAKNAVLFGTFAASSWQGMNFANITTFRLPVYVRRNLVRDGFLSRLALQEPFSMPEGYIKLLPPLPPSGHPVLDRTRTPDGTPNMNHLIFISASRIYLQDALFVVRHQPSVYVDGITRALYVYFRPSSDNDFLQANARKISALVRAWNLFFYGQPREGEDIRALVMPGAPYHRDTVAWLVVLAFLCAVPLGLFVLVQQWAHMAEPIRLTVLLLWWNIVYVTAVGSLFDLGENNRFRYVVDPLIYVLAYWVVCQVLQSACRSSRSRNSESLVGEKRRNALPETQQPGTPR